MYRNTRAIAIACMCCAVPAAGFAQAEVRANEWSRGTDITGLRERPRMVLTVHR